MSGGGAIDGESVAIVLFLAFVTVCLLLCGLAAADQDDPRQFYTGSASLGPVPSGLAIAGDYLSAATLLSTTGSIALKGVDGVLFACATVVSLALTGLLLAEPLRKADRYTLGDVVAERLRRPSVRTAMGITTIVVLLPLLLVQLTAAGRITTVMLGLPEGALTVCTAATGALMVCYSAFGGMRGTGLIQILKTVVVVPVVVLVGILVLQRFGGNPARLLHAAAANGGPGYTTPGMQFGDSLVGRLDLIGFGATLVLGAACLPHITMRFHPVRSARALRISMRWAVGSVALICAALAVIGLGAAALVGPEALGAGDPAGGTALLMVTATLDPASGAAGESVLFAVVACAVFATALAAVAGITLAAAASLAHDLPSRDRRGKRGRSPGTREAVRARWAVALVGAVAVLLSMPAHTRNPQVLVSFTFGAAAASIVPVLVCTFFWRGFSARGALYALYGAPLLTALLMLFSPAVSGTPVALLPEYDFHWFPLQTPGLVGIPAGFLLCVLGSLPLRRTDDSGYEPGRGTDEVPRATHWAAARSPASDVRSPM
ncbi:sodium/solute symporter [Streptomyces fructofermentans]|uniref:sodium/solute symporter n=1 Tax=Streptomyces fructofermentans TaxID=152141 RepID=UPI0033FBB2E0